MPALRFKPVCSLCARRCLTRVQCAVALFTRSFHVPLLRFFWHSRRRSQKKKARDINAKDDQGSSKEKAPRAHGVVDTAEEKKYRLKPKVSIETPNVANDRGKESMWRLVAFHANYLNSLNSSKFDAQQCVWFEPCFRFFVCAAFLIANL